jgi:hypothetical protein
VAGACVDGAVSVLPVFRCRGEEVVVAVPARLETVGVLAETGGKRLS